MQAQPIASKIEAVTVYSKGARITRAAELARSGNGFPPTVRLTGLPLTLDDSSVRVRLEALQGADGVADLPVAAYLRVVLEVPERDPSLLPDDEALVEARKEEKRLSSLVAQIERELGRLDRVKLVARPKGADGEPPGESPAAARLSLVEFRERQEQKLQEEVSDARDRLDKARRRREHLEELDRRRSSARQARKHELRKSVVVTIRDGSAAPERLRLLLEYQVPGARWAPAYTLKLDESLTDAQLSLRAVVAQATGEDWSGVAMTLSTASPQRWTELPELSSLRIGRRQPTPPKTGWRPPPTGVEELYRDYDRSFRKEFFGEAAKTKPATAPRRPLALGPLMETAMLADEDAPIAAAAAPPPRAPEPRAIAPPAAAMPRVRSTILPAKVGGQERPTTYDARVRFDLSNSAEEAMLEETLSGALEEALPPVEEDVGLRASGEMLSYGNLRMPSPRSEGRGKLALADRRELYVELLMSTEITISFDIIAVINKAVQSAGRIERKGLPSGCTWAWSEDYDYAYAAETPIDVPSDGDIHSVPLLTRKATPHPLYVVVPRESTDVFRTLRIENPFAAPLLQGPADIYEGGDFLLTSAVKFTPPGAAIELGLGVEQRIKVSRNSSFREDAAGLIGGSRALDHQINIEVANNTAGTVEAEVRERIPIVPEGEEEIKVTLKDVSPAWESFEPFPSAAAAERLEGGYRWRFPLDAGERKRLQAGYQITISAKHELIGGNRREV